MRLAEAKRAESSAVQAGRKLRDHLNRGLSGEIIQADFDRLELAVSDLDRRVLTSRDAQARCSAPAELAGEIERLRRRADAWRDYLQTSRRAEPGAQSEQLEALLREPGAR